VDKFEKTYMKEDKKDTTEKFLIDFLQYLKTVNNFYKISDIIVENTETEKKYTASILFLSKNNTKKNYILPKKTDDKENQIFTESMKEVEQ